MTPEIIMANVICHICLRTDIIAVELATDLSDFLDELCEYKIIENPRYKYCTICVHLLKKFYNFKQKCLKACKILKSLKGRQKILPTNLHEQIPSSIGLCSTLPPYMLLEHQQRTDIDLLETKTNLNIEPNITLNNTELYNKQNLQTSDPILPEHIEVKDEPMHDELDSDIETAQAADGENKYIFTTSNCYLTIDGNFKEDTQIIKLEADKEELNTDRNKECSKDNAKKSKINDFLKSLEEEIKEFEDNSGDADDEVKVTTFMINNDPLRDDESLNSRDDIESDISDRDDESLPIDEQNSESDTDSLSDILEKAKNKKIKVNEICDLELAEILHKVDRKNKILKRRVKFLRCKAKFKGDLLKLFDNDEYDFGDGVKISKELFLKMYDRCEKSSYHFNSYSLKDTSNKNKTDEFLRSLYKMYDPEYETLFDIEYLDTEEKKLQELNRRKDRAEYQNAPYKCERCYKGFEFERMHAYHMKKHDETISPHECHICFLRFPSALTCRSHVLHCHSAVYVCRLCQVTFYYFDSMLNHFNLHKGVEFPCPICNGIYRTATGLANHKRTHVTSHICTTCARSFVSALGLSNHRKFKHKGAPEPADASKVRCTECSLTLDSQKVYKRHLRVSHRKNPYVCKCLKSFPSMAELRQHKVDEGHLHSTWNIQENIGPIKMKGRPSKRRQAQKVKAAVRTCPVCQEEVPTDKPGALYKHHERYHPGVPYQADESKVRKYLCDECGKRFVSQSLLLDHKNTHTGARPYQCPECPRAFATALNLQHHTVRHRPPSHKCKFCGKLFQTTSNLNIHLRIHINDRRYICDDCSASFIHANSLTAHIRGVHQHQRRVRKHKKISSSSS